jgi:eukaryotic-like serine/threonine-protein kinase
MAALHQPIDTVLNKKYRIVAHIKKGGMANIYKAEDMKKGNKLCAIKEMIELQADEEMQWKFTECFEREMQILANLRHFGIPDVSDYFVFNGRYYIVLEYIPGKNLEDLQVLEAPNGFPERKALSWTLELSEILEYIHSQNPPVVHRDIKPSNIILRKEGRLILVDFGIAKFFSTEIRTGTQIGTPGFIAPEHYKGNPEPRSDLFSLGVTLYQLLTGIDPSKEVPYNLPPLDQVKPDLSCFAVALVERLMAIKPVDRFKSADELFTFISSNREIKSSSPTRPDLVQVKQPLSASVIQPPPVSQGSSSETSKAQAGSQDVKPPAQHEAAPRAPSPPSTPPPPSSSRKSKNDGDKAHLPSELSGKSSRDFFDGAPKTGKKGTEIVFGKDGSRMVFVPDGIVLVGALIDDEAVFTSEKPINAVKTSAFYIDRFPVTIKQFMQFLRETNYDYPHKETLDSRYDNHPIVNITWYDALTYARWAGKRLPLEIEWEKAARGTDGRKYPWGNIWDREKLNCALLGSLRTTPVGLFPKGSSPYGCQEMVGNVWEWTLDSFSNYPYRGPSTKKSEPISVRGGSWKSGKRECRCTAREKSDPLLFTADLGFRCAISIG